MATEFRRVVELEPPALLCPYPAYRELRAAGPAVWIPELDAFVVSRFDDIVEVSRNVAVFSSASAMGPRPIPVLLQELFNERRRREGRPERPLRVPDPVLLSADPPEHGRHRTFLARAFSPRRVAILEARITELASELVSAMAQRGECEFVAEVAVPLPLMLLAEILGVDETDIATLKRWSDDFTSTFGSAPPSEDRLLELAATAFEFERHFHALVDERRQAPRDDLLTEIVQIHLDGEVPLTTGEIVTMLAQILVAGNETTTTMLTHAARILATRPDLFDTLRAEPDRVPAYIDEVLRLECPIQGFWRTARTEAAVGDVTIPAGAQVLILYGSGNRDDEAYAAPDHLDLDRAPARPHLAFGTGAHYCLGAHLARTEGRIVVERMVTTIERIELRDRQELVPLPSFLLHGVETLWLRLEVNPEREMR